MFKDDNKLSALPSIPVLLLFLFSVFQTLAKISALPLSVPPATAQQKDVDSV